MTDTVANALSGAPSSSRWLRSALGFDFGTQRIGVAYGLLPDVALSSSARPLCVLKAADGVPDWERIAKLIRQWQPDCMVVGLPYNLDGSDGQLLPRAVKFGHRLHGRFNLPVYGMDERLSSRAAIEEVTAAGKSKAKIKAIDDVAAKIILETWFQEIARGIRR